MQNRVSDVAPGSVAANGDDRGRSGVEGTPREDRLVARSRRSLKPRIADADRGEGAPDCPFDACTASTARGRVQYDANEFRNETLLKVRLSR